jgi:hypothetical protein
LTESTPAREEPIHPKPSTPIEKSRPKKTASNLQLRLLTAAVLIPAVLYVIFKGGYWVLATVEIITVLGLSEFSSPAPPCPWWPSWGASTTPPS